MKISKDDRIGIIGGGLAGLITAVALRYYGFTEVKVFEQKADNGEQDQMFHIGTNGLHALTSINLSERVSLKGTAWKKREFRLKNGKVIKSIDMSSAKTKGGFPPTSVSASEFLSLLTRELPEDSFIKGEEFISYTENSKSVEAHFSSGLAENVSLLIGADGLHSRVRLQMCGESELRSSERKVYWGHFLIKEDFLSHIDALEELLKEPYIEYIDGGKGVSLFKPAEDQIMCYINIPAESSLENVDITARLLELFKRMPEGIKACIEKVPYSNWKSVEMADRKPIKGWANGRILLAGNSVHPSLPISHQNTTMDIESGVLIGRLLAEQLNIKKATKSFEKKRRKRTRTATRMARKMERRLYWKSPIGLFFRNQFSDLFPDPTASSNFQKLNLSEYY